MSTADVAPSFSEYTDARYILDHPHDFDAAELNSAQQWVTEFETAVRDAVAARFQSPRTRELAPGTDCVVMPGWADMPTWMHGALFDAAMAGARTAQGGAR